MTNDALTDSLAADQARDAHADGCIECRADGCTGCPSAFCDLPKLVEHCRERMCPGCKPAFDAHVTNKCDGTTCHCDGAPEPVDDVEETTPVEPLTDREIARLDPLGVYGRFAMVAALALALFGGGACAHGPAPAVEAETVGQLSASYNSIAVAPLKHDAPPQLGFVAGSDDDDVSSVATTVTRTVDAGAADGEAPEVVSKGAGLAVGAVR